MKLKQVPEAFLPAYNAGCKALKGGDEAKAKRLFEHSAKICPAAWVGLSSADIQASDWKEAYNKAEMAYTNGDNDRVRSAALNNMGTAINGLGNREDAFPLFKRAANLDKRNLDAMMNVGLCLKWAGKIDEAMEWLDRAERRNPLSDEVKFAKSLAHLVNCNFEKGKAGYEKRPGAKLEIGIPHWIGQDIKGKRLLVYCEQGAGDTIQMARYTKHLVNRGAKVWFAVQQGLEKLFDHLDHVEQVFSTADEFEVGQFDYVVRTMSLPGLLDDWAGWNGPYLKAKAPFELPNKKRVNVGFSWGGSFDHKHDIWRSTKVSQWRELIDLDDVQFYSLQVGERVEELRAANTDAVDLSDRLTDYQQTANAIDELDLVISVDTSVVHVAGGMGKPVWMLTPAAPDWRWQLDREDSPIYPSLRLFRQQRDHYWQPVFDRIKRELNQLAGTSCTRATLEPAHTSH